MDIINWINNIFHSDVQKKEEHEKAISKYIKINRKINIKNILIQIKIIKYLKNVKKKKIKKFGQLHFIENYIFNKTIAI